MGPDRAALVEALSAANVQFVVVDELSGSDPLRVVVSRHPTNLDALGRALDRLGATLRLDLVHEGEGVAPDEQAAVDGIGGLGEGSVTVAGGAQHEGDSGSELVQGPSAGSAEAPGRIGDHLGTMTVDTALGGLTLMFGGPSSSLYAETVAAAEPRQIGERLVPWAPTAADVVPAPRSTGRALGRRLLSLVEGLTHLVEQRAAEDREDGRHVEAPLAETPEAGVPDDGTQEPNPR